MYARYRFRPPFGVNLQYQDGAFFSGHLDSRGSCLKKGFNLTLVCARESDERPSFVGPEYDYDDGYVLTNRTWFDGSLLKSDITQVYIKTSSLHKFESNGNCPGSLSNIIVMSNPIPGEFVEEFYEDNEETPIDPSSFSGRVYVYVHPLVLKIVDETRGLVEIYRHALSEGIHPKKALILKPNTSFVIFVPKKGSTPQQLYVDLITDNPDRFFFSGWQEKFDYVEASPGGIIPEINSFRDQSTLFNIEEYENGQLVEEGIKTYHFDPPFQYEDNGIVSLNRKQVLLLADSIYGNCYVDITGVDGTIDSKTWTLVSLRPTNDTMLKFERVASAFKLNNIPVACFILIKGMFTKIPDCWNKLIPKTKMRLVRAAKSAESSPSIERRKVTFESPGRSEKSVQTEDSPYASKRRVKAGKEYITFTEADEDWYGRKDYGDPNYKFPSSYYDDMDFLKQGSRIKGVVAGKPVDMIINDIFDDEDTSVTTFIVNIETQRAGKPALVTIKVDLDENWEEPDKAMKISSFGDSSVRAQDYRKMMNLVDRRLARTVFKEELVYE